MARTRQLPEFTQELIRWRWNIRPTIKSLAAEYHVSISCISDILNPELRKRRRKKPKKAEYEGPAGGCQSDGVSQEADSGWRQEDG